MPENPRLIIPGQEKKEQTIQIQKVHQWHPEPGDVLLVEAPEAISDLEIQEIQNFFKKELGVTAVVLSGLKVAGVMKKYDAERWYKDEHA